MERKKDTLDKLVLFLAKRDGIDKLVKTLQYAGKLGHYRAATTNPELAERCKRLEVAAGLSRKAFRMGRFLTGFNELRTTRFTDRNQQVLCILGYGGEMVYWFFDHILWLSRIGFLPSSLTDRMGFISAFGEAFGYLFFITSDLITLRQGLQRQAELQQKLQQILLQQQRLAKRQEIQELGSEEIGGERVQHEARLLQKLQNSQELQHHHVGKRRETQELAGGGGGGEGLVVLDQQVKQLGIQIRGLKVERAMCVMSIVANVSDLVIAMADVEPRWKVVTHPVVLGVSGLASAWSGGYRNWPGS